MTALRMPPDKGDTASELPFAGHLFHTERRRMKMTMTHLTAEAVAFHCELSGCEVAF